MYSIYNIAEESIVQLICAGASCWLLEGPSSPQIESILAAQFSFWRDHGYYGLKLSIRSSSHVGDGRPRSATAPLFVLLFESSSTFTLPWVSWRYSKYDNIKTILDI